MDPLYRGHIGTLETVLYIDNINLRQDKMRSQYQFKVQRVQGPLLLYLI